MSLQRGENVRGWSGVTKNMALSDNDSTTGRFAMIGLIAVLLIVAAVAYRLYQADISNLARVPLLVALLVFLLALIFRIYLTMGGRGSIVDMEHAGSATAGADVSAAAHTAEAEQQSQAATAAAQAAAARAAEEERQRTAAAAAAAKAAEEQAAAARAAEQERQRQAEAAEAARQKAEADAAAAAAASASAASGPDRDGDGVIEGKDEGTKPETLDGPRGGQADDLKLIKGVGPKLEGLCNSLGFWHFDQIANWTPEEVAWVDSNLEGFSGRVTRDEWVSQARILAEGGTTEFAERQKDG